MKRRVFYSFHYDRDAWRTGQIRNIGVVEGNEPVSPNDWEKVKKEGDEAIKRWIAAQMRNRSCVVVLIGSETAERKWVRYEIQRGWEDEKGVLGIYIHNLKDQYGKTTRRGANPFELVSIGGTKLSSIVKAYDPPYQDSKRVYEYIADNLQDWIEEAIRIRESA